MRRATLLVLLVLALPASAMAAGPPTVSKQAPANITQTAATLRATVNPRGQATSFHFEYGPTAALGAATGEAPAGAGTTSRAASARIAGLEPATTYFWRVVATNAAGVTASPQGTFKTATPPGTIRIRVAQGTVPFGAVTAVSGQVLGPQAGGATIAIERQRFPYNEPYNQLGTTVRTAADGTFAFASVGPFFGPTHVRAVRRTGPAVASPAATVRTRVAPGLRAQSVLGGRVRLLGSTAPGGVVGARVTLQRRLSDGRFVSIRSTRARRLTAFRAAYSFTIRRRSKSSVYRVVVTPAADSGQLQGTSRPRRVSARHT